MWGLSVVITPHLIIITAIKNESFPTCDNTAWVDHISRDEDWLENISFAFLSHLLFQRDPHTLWATYYCLYLRPHAALGVCQSISVRDKSHDGDDIRERALSKRKSVKVREYGSVQRRPIKTLHSLPQELKHSQLPKKLQVQTDAAGQASAQTHRHTETQSCEWEAELRTSNPKDVHREQVTPVVNGNILVSLTFGKAATVAMELKCHKGKTWT